MFVCFFFFDNDRYDFSFLKCFKRNENDLFVNFLCFFSCSSIFCETMSRFFVSFSRLIFFFFFFHYAIFPRIKPRVPQPRFYRYTRFVTFTRYYANERVSRICISHRSSIVKRFYLREIVIMMHPDYSRNLLLLISLLPSRNFIFIRTRIIFFGINNERFKIDLNVFLINISRTSVCKKRK